MSTPKKIKVKESELDDIRHRFVVKMDQFIATHPSIRTQLEFSELTGIHRNRLSLFVKGKAIPGTEEILRLIKATTFSASEIITGNESEKDSLNKQLSDIESQIKAIKKRL